MGWADAFGSSAATPTSPAPAAAPAASGGAGGWASAFGGSGGGAANDPVQIAQNALNKTTGMVTGNPSTPAWAKAFASNIQAGKSNDNSILGVLKQDLGNPVMKALSVLDLGRSTVVSTARQLEHVATGNGWNTDQWRQNIADHIGTGQLVHSGLNNGTPEHGLRRIGSDFLGFVGDVGLDPATYLGGLGHAGGGAADTLGHAAEAAAAKDVAANAAAEADRLGGLVSKASQATTGATDAAARASSETAASLSASYAKAQAAAEQAMAHAQALDPAGVLTHDTVAKLTQGGAAALGADEKAALGVRTGLGAYVPGTRTAASLGLMDEPKMVRLLPGGLTDPLMEGLHGATNALKASGPMQSLASKFTQFPELRQAIRDAASSGDSKAVTDLVNTLRAQPVAGGAARSFLQEWGQKAAAAWKGVPDWAHSDAVSAIEGDTQKAADLLHSGIDVQPIKDFYSQVKEAAAAKGIDLGNRIDEYFPHQLTQAAQDAAATGVNRGRGTFEGALKRSYGPGDQFLGETLQHGTIDEMNAIAHDKFGEGAYDLFSKQGPEVTNRYVRGLSNAVGQKAYADELGRLGVVRDAYAPGMKQVIDKAGRASVREAQSQSPALLRAAADHFGAAAQGTRAEAGDWVAGSDRMVPNAEAFDHSGTVLSQAENNVSNSQDIARALHTEAAKADSMSQMLGKTADDVQVRGALGFKGYQEATAKMATDGWTNLGDKGAFAGKQMPDYVKATIDKMNALKAAPRAETSKFLKYYDRWIGLWKNYQLAMPGKALRHQIGAIWNANLGNVALDNASHAMGAWRAFQTGGIDAVKEADRAWVQQFVDAGLKHADIFHDADLIGKGSTTWNPLSRNFKYFAANRNAQSLAQDYVRASMFYDSIEKGAHPLEAASKVRTMLGDPHMLTQFEKGTVRRIVPFYTFMRTNMPVQLENMVTQPGKFMEFLHAKQNIERDVPIDKLMPQFYKDTMAIRTPMTNGGNRVYLSPDLPFTRMGEYLSGPRQLAAQTTPLLKLPLEMMMNEPMYTGQPFNPSAKNAPGAWQSIPGLMAALSHLGLANKVVGNQNTNLTQGGYSMTPKSSYLLESLLPPLGQVRRALPMGEPGYAGRQATTLASDVLGQNFRTLEPVQQSGELYARNAAMKALVEKLQNQGYLPSYIRGFHK